MAAVTIRGLPDAVHRALRVRAARNGRSTEAEVRAILEAAALPRGRFKLGSELAKIRKLLDGAELDITRDKSPVRPVNFDE